MAYKVFISYSSPDKMIAGQILSVSQNTDIRVYLYQNDQQFGKDITQKVKKEIMSSDCIIALLSASSQQSSFVNQEIGFAEGQDKLIIPVICPGFNKDNLAMLTGKEPVYYDYSNPTQALEQIKMYLNKKKNEKDLATGILWGIGFLLLGALITNSEG